MSKDYSREEWKNHDYDILEKLEEVFFRLRPGHRDIKQAAEILSRSSEYIKGFIYIVGKSPSKNYRSFGALEMEVEREDGEESTMKIFFPFKNKIKKIEVHSCPPLEDSKVKKILTRLALEIEWPKSTFIPDYFSDEEDEYSSI